SLFFQLKQKPPSCGAVFKTSACSTAVGGEPSSDRTSCAQRHENHASGILPSSKLSGAHPLREEGREQYRASRRQPERKGRNRRPLRSLHSRQDQVPWSKALPSPCGCGKHA